jgi:hypothetical protein
LSSRSPPAAFAGALFLITAAQAQVAVPCPYQSQASPGALIGQEGGSKADEYWFTHISDVINQDKPEKRIIFNIDNNHPDNYLPAEWVQVGNIVLLRFRNIAPGGCGYSDCPAPDFIDKDPVA